MSNEEEQQEEKQTESEEPTWEDAGLGDPAQDEQAESSVEAPQGEVEAGGDGAEPASFSQLEETGQTEPVGNLDMIMDIPVVLSVELGRTKMLINEILQLGQGSIIELQKMAGEPMEILINEKLMARGEVVVVNDKFGIRLTDIVSPMDRIKQLG
ncbi:MAG: flagellar motor switch protein FliN [Thermodesulfobacteriota bacterium]